VREEPDPSMEGLKGLDTLYSMQEFYAILNSWWRELDNNRGNLALSAFKVAQFFV
jgi:hypothetical protein